MTDPLHILVGNIAGLLLIHGASPIHAWVQAEEVGLAILEEWERAGLPVGNALRRVRVYNLRSQGLGPAVVAARLGIHRCQVHRDYRQELARRRSAA